MSATNKHIGFLKISVRTVVVAVNVFLAAGLLASAYCGTVPPSSWHPAVVVAMTFPAWLAAAVAALAIDLLIWRRAAFIPAIAMLMCAGSIKNYCPLHLSKPPIEASGTDSLKVLTLMTYNVYGFQDQDKEYEGDNRQIDYIIEHHPDLVCIQESQQMAATPSNRISQKQLDTLHRLYPYISDYGNDLTLMSKYPVEKIDLEYEPIGKTTTWVGAWQVRVGLKKITVFSVHLRSLLFSSDERTNFKEMTTPDKIDDLNRSDIRYARNDLLPKIIDASLDRQKQAIAIANFVNRYGGKNVILCGDFNDPVGCYPLHYLYKACQLSQVYPKVGCGPMITYNANHFLFRIDHILYRGSLTPYSMRRGHIKASDHYPLLATFLID